VNAFREILLCGIWIFLMWLGLTALTERNIGLLALYVFLGSTGVAMSVAWFWSSKDR